jgi:hypothetical protein
MSHFISTIKVLILNPACAPHMTRLLTQEPMLESGWRELPTIVNESLVHQFRYWDNQIKVGMRYRNELFTLLQSYPIDDRLKASDLGCEYQRQGIEVCITASKSTYSIWLNLKSLSQLSASDRKMIDPARDSDVDTVLSIS